MREKRSGTFQGALRPRFTPPVEVVPELKVVLLGSENAGKINVLLASYALANDSQGSSSKSTDFLGEEKMGFSIPLTHDGKRYRLSVIDSSSCDQFRAVRDMQIRMGDCFLLVYSSSSWTSFREIEKLCRDIATAKETEVPIVLVSNNIDEEREREEEEIRKDRVRKKGRRTASSEDRKERRLSDTVEVISSADSGSDHKPVEKEEPQGPPKKVPREEGEKLALRLNCRFFELGSSTPSSPSSSSSPTPYPHITLSSPSTTGTQPSQPIPLSSYAPVLKEAYLYLVASYATLSKKDRKTCAVM